MSPYMYSDIQNDPRFQWFILVLLGIDAVLFVIGMVAYILGSIGFHRIAKRRGIHHPWLAWIPVGRGWLMGCISDQYRYIARNERKNRRAVLLVLGIVMLLVSAVGSVSATMGVTKIVFMGERLSDADALVSLLQILLPALLEIGVGIAFIVMYFLALNDVYLSCTPNGSVALLILSILFGFLTPFFVFAIRNKDGGMPPRKGLNVPGQPQWNPGKPEEI